MSKSKPYQQSTSQINENAVTRFKFHNLEHMVWKVKIATTKKYILNWAFGPTMDDIE